MKTRTRTIAKVNPTPQQQVTTTLERKSISPEFTLSQGKAFSSANGDSNLSSHNLNQISPFRSAGQHILIPREVDSETVLEQLSIHNFSQAIVQNKPNKFITAINSISNKNSSIQRWGNPFKKIGKAIKKGFDWVKEKIVKPIKRAANRLLNGLKKQGKRLINRLKRAAKKVIGKAKRVILNFIRKIKRAVRKVILKAKRFATKVIRKAQSYARKIGRKVAAIAKKLLTYARNLAKKYAQKMIKLTNYFLKIGNPQKAQKLIQRLNQFAGKIVDWATKKVMGLVRRATAIVNKVMQRATKQLSRLIQRTAGVVQRLVKKVTSFAQKLIDRAIKGVENLIQKAGNITHLFDKAKSKLNGILGPARGKANWLINSMMKLANKILRGFLLPLARKAGSWMRRLLRPGMRFVSRTLNKAASGIGKIIKRATNKLTQSMQWLIGKIKKLIELYTEKIIKPSLQMGATIVKRIISGVIKFIENKILAPLKAFFEFMNLISQILAKAAGSIDNILAHPVRFIKNLFSGVKQGFSGFISRIGMHLEKGLQTFLFGSLGNSGIEIPKTFDLSGLISVVSQVSGISYDSIRERAAGKLGEDKVAFIEEGAAAAQEGNLGEFAEQKAQGYVDNQAAAVKEKAGPIGKIADIFKLLKEGPAGIVKYFQELDFSSLITGIIGEIKEYLIQEIVQKAVIQVISYLTPGAGWLKAAIDALRMMYALFIERAQQVKEFLDGFTDSVVNIAKNAIAPAVKLLESSLGKTLPLLIGVLADYLGIGGIPQKIKGFLMKGRKWVDANVMPIIDKILDKIAGIFAKLPSANIADYIPKGMGIGNLYGKLRQYFKPYTKKTFKTYNEAKKVVNTAQSVFKRFGIKSLNLEQADKTGHTFNIIAAKPLPGRKPVINSIPSRILRKPSITDNLNSNGVMRSPKLNNIVRRNSISTIQTNIVSLSAKPSSSRLSTIKSEPIISNFGRQKSPLISKAIATKLPSLQKQAVPKQNTGTVRIKTPPSSPSSPSFKVLPGGKSTPVPLEKISFKGNIFRLGSKVLGIVSFFLFPPTLHAPTSDKPYRVQVDSYEDIPPDVREKIVGCVILEDGSGALTLSDGTQIILRKKGGGKLSLSSNIDNDSETSNSDKFAEPLEAARNTFKLLYQNIESIKPLLEKYPSVDIRSSGDVFGNYKDVKGFVKELNLTAKRRNGESSIEVHHLFENNFAQNFGITENEGWSVALESSDHAEFTKYMRKRLPHSTFFDINDLFEIHSEMYRDLGHSEWIDELRKFLKQHSAKIRNNYQQEKIPGANDSDFNERKQKALDFLDNL